MGNILGRIFPLMSEGWTWWLGTSELWIIFFTDSGNNSKLKKCDIMQCNSSFLVLFYCQENVFWFSQEKCRIVLIKGYLRYKANICHKVALDVQLMNFFVWSKNNVSLSKYLDFCVFVKSTDFKICDVIISIAT